MSTPKRILLVLAAFIVVNAAAFVVLNFLGIERGEWRYAAAIGLIVATVGAVWRLTAPNTRPPAQSS
jgi:hypothetical protein